MKDVNETKEYEKAVFDAIHERIMKNVGCSRKMARALLVNALAYNVTLAEIDARIALFVERDIKEAA